MPSNSAAASIFLDGTPGHLLGLYGRPSIYLAFEIVESNRVVLHPVVVHVAPANHQVQQAVQQGNIGPRPHCQMDIAAAGRFRPARVDDD